MGYIYQICMVKWTLNHINVNYVERHFPNCIQHFSPLHHMYVCTYVHVPTSPLFSEPNSFAKNNFFLAFPNIGNSTPA